MSNATDSRNPDRTTVYRDLQRSIPRLDKMYRLMRGLVDRPATLERRVLIVGAGGGREIAELSHCRHCLEITAVDTSRQNLVHARQVAGMAGLSDRIEFHIGTTESLRAGKPFDVATSLLVMHNIKDDGGKLTYLSAIRDRLSDDGLLIHADVCIDDSDGHDHLVAEYLSHAKRSGIGKEVTDIELEAISRLPIVSGARTRALFSEARFDAPREVFRSFWYRCWIVTP